MNTDNFTIFHSIYDNVQGENFGAVIVQDEGRTVGQIKFSVWKNEVLVTWVWVDEDYRRNSIATDMWEHLQSQYRGHNILTNEATMDGDAFLRSMGKSSNKIWTDEVPAGLGYEPSLRLYRTSETPEFSVEMTNVDYAIRLLTEDIDSLEENELTTLLREYRMTKRNEIMVLDRLIQFILNEIWEQD